MAAPKKKRSSGKTFRFQLSLGGVVGLAVVCCCLFLWMFLIGVWAGQTILLPAARPKAPAVLAGHGKQEVAPPAGVKERAGKTTEKK